MASPALEARVGTTLREKWTLERLLGWGGMGAVYVGVHHIGRRDAIKILHPEALQIPGLKERFLREASAANLFRHEAAVEIRDVDTTEDGLPFLVMELVEGETLAQHAARRPIAVDELLRLVDELLDVLAAAHQRGLVHRDIKPDNLLVRPDGRLKVLDFGIARIAHSSLTGSGSAIGTITYMAPEQVRGEAVDGRADVFAVGATMFRLLTGKPLHEADSEPELAFKMATLPAPGLASAAPGAPLALCQVVDRALAFGPSARYPDAATMQSDVRALRAGKEPEHAARGQAPTLRGGSGERLMTKSLPDHGVALAARPGPADAPTAVALTSLSPGAQPVVVEPHGHLARAGRPRWLRVLSGLVAVPFLSLGVLMVVIAFRKPGALAFILVVALWTPGVLALAYATSAGHPRR